MNEETASLLEEQELEEGQFEVDGVIYELRYNTQKIKTIELVTKKVSVQKLFRITVFCRYK